MNYPFILVILFLIVPCDNLPTSFDSYDQAISSVRGATFKIDEKVNTNKSSWIRRIEYYSCDGNEGYLIMTLKNTTAYSIIANLTTKYDDGDVLYKLLINYTPETPNGTIIEKMVLK